MPSHWRHPVKNPGSIERRSFHHGQPQRPITALRQRFGRKRSGLAGELDPSDPQVQLQQLGDRLRERRESLDLTASAGLDTRVSTPVIEALEKAWSDRLPEAAFLRTIVDKLADRLGLDAGEIVETLQQNLPKQTSRFGRRHGPPTRFTLSSIELFNTWQGTIAYSLLVAGVLYGLNLQHRQLHWPNAKACNRLLPIRSKPAKWANGRKSAPARSCCACIPICCHCRNPTITAGTARHNDDASSTAQPAQGTLQLTLPEGSHLKMLACSGTANPSKLIQPSPTPIRCRFGAPRTAVVASRQLLQATEGHQGHQVTAIANSSCLRLCLGVETGLIPQAHQVLQGTTAKSAVEASAKRSSPNRVLQRDGQAPLPPGGGAHH